jgi:hypothetical protein
MQVCKSTAEAFSLPGAAAAAATSNCKMLRLLQ